MSATDPHQAPRLAIVAALQEEVSHILEHMQSKRCELVAGRSFWTATYHEHPVVVVLSGIGKVAAAITATTLIERFGVKEILFTGVAGSLDTGVLVGDVVIGSHFIQHDMDASPLFVRYLVPGYDEMSFKSNVQLSKRLKLASSKVLENLERYVSEEIVSKFKLTRPRMHSGLVLSGDQFVSNDALRESLKESHPLALVVEMEGAALAQVCQDYGIDFCLMRTVSDGAGEHAAKDFTAFLHEVASRYSALIVRAYLDINDR